MCCAAAAFSAPALLDNHLPSRLSLRAYSSFFPKELVLVVCRDTAFVAFVNGLIFLPILSHFFVLVLIIHVALTRVVIATACTALATKLVQCCKHQQLVPSMRQQGRGLCLLLLFFSFLFCFSCFFCLLCCSCSSSSSSNGAVAALLKQQRSSQPKNIPVASYQQRHSTLPENTKLNKLGLLQMLHHSTPLLQRRLRRVFMTTLCCNTSA